MLPTQKSLHLLRIILQARCIFIVQIVSHDFQMTMTENKPWSPVQSQCLLDAWELEVILGTSFMTTVIIETQSKATKHTAILYSAAFYFPATSKVY
jgi:hypothetical protein